MFAHSPLELLERDDDLQQLLDRVDAAAAADRPRGPRGTASTRAPRHPRPRSGSARARPRRRRAAARSARARRVTSAAGCALDDLARAVSDHLLVADDVEEDVAARRGAPCSSTDLRRPQRRREPALHVGRAPTVEPPVDDGARRTAPATTRSRSPTGTTSTCALNASERPPPEPGPPRDDQRMRRERRRRADVPAVELEAERLEEVADEADAAARLVREVRRLLRLALGAEPDQRRAAGPAARLCERRRRPRPRRAASPMPRATTRARAATDDSSRRVAAQVVAVRAEHVHAPARRSGAYTLSSGCELARRGRCAPGRSSRPPRP